MEDQMRDNVTQLEILSDQIDRKSKEVKQEEGRIEKYTAKVLRKEKQVKAEIERLKLWE